MVGGLGEALLHPVGNLPPFSECEMEFVRVLALLPGNCAKERNNVIGHVVLQGRAVTDGINISQWGSYDPEVRICHQGMLVVLPFQLVRKCFTKVRSRCTRVLATAIPGLWDPSPLTDTS